MLLRLSTLFLFSFFLVSCSTEKWSEISDPIKPPDLSEAKKRDESYNVYLAVLRKFGTKPIAIRETTSTGILSASVDFDGTGMTGELIASYQLENQTSLTLEDRFSTSGDYILIKDGEDPKSSYKKRFEETGKGISGLMSFSRVGFDQNMTRALVIANYTCGSLCGHGGFYFLAKTEKGWEVVWQENMWIS